MRMGNAIPAVPDPVAIPSY
nr:hypothetical protein [Tanacetum cinerariifolium]